MIRLVRYPQLLCLAFCSTFLPAQKAIPKLERLGSFTAIGGNFGRLAFGREGKMLVTAGESGDLAVWDVKRRKIVLSRPSVGARPLSLALSPAKTHVILACGLPLEGTWSIEIATGKAQLLDASGAYSVAFSPDGATCAWLVRGPDGPRLMVLAMSALRGFVVPSPQHADLPFRADHCVFSPDGARIAVSKGRLSRVSAVSLSYAVHDLGNVPERVPGRVIGYSADGRAITHAHSYRLHVGGQRLPPRPFWDRSRARLLPSRGRPNSRTNG